MYDTFARLFLSVFAVVYSAVFVAIVVAALKSRVAGGLRKAVLLASPASRQSTNLERVRRHDTHSPNAAAYALSPDSRS